MSASTAPTDTTEATGAHWLQRLVRPYYRDSHTAIILGDCREVLARNEVPTSDLVLTDPPYGVGEQYASFDDTRLSVRQLIGESIELIRRQSSVVLLTPGIANVYRYPEPNWILSWVTPAGSGSGPWGFCCWQPVLAYGKCPYLAAGLGRRQDYLIHTEASEKNGHPCPKPIGLWKKLLLRGSPHEGQTVLDPFMGSGTTLLAAKETNRYAVGIEIEERYAEIAAKRLEQGQLL